MTTNSKRSLGSCYKVEIPKVGFFCIKSMPSDTILPIVESRSTQPSNRLETSVATVCFPSLVNDGENSNKIKAEEVDVILIIPSGPAQP